MPIEKKPISWFKPAPFNPRKKRTGDRVIAALKHHQDVLACK